MTAQISDTIIYKDKRFCLVGVNGEGLFNPDNYGIKPFVKCTACYKGFYCTYTFVDNYFRLSEIYLGLDRKNELLIKYGRGGLKLFGQIPSNNRYFCDHH